MIIWNDVPYILFGLSYGYSVASLYGINRKLNLMHKQFLDYAFILHKEIVKDVRNSKL